MTSFSSYLMAGLAFVLALDYLAPPVGTGLKFEMWPTVLSPTPVAKQYVPAGQMVDRKSKGDRLPVAAERSRAPAVTADERPIPVMPQRAVPIGCDAVFSTLTVSKESNSPGWCLTEIGQARKLAGLR